MFRPTEHASRFTAYRETITDSFQFQRHSEALYHLANLSLDELRTETSKGVEPSKEAFDKVAHRLDLAASTSEGINHFDNLRARLLRAWMRPIVWSGVVSMDGLTSGQSKRVSETIELEEAGDDTSVLLAEALAAYDDIRAFGADLSQYEVQLQLSSLAGFINEATPAQLAVRHNTAKRFITPSLSFEDAINPHRHALVDGILYDNRSKHAFARVYGFQVKSKPGASTLRYGAPIVDGDMLGNRLAANRWPNETRQFGTARRLVTERQKKRLSNEAKSTLERITANMYRRITGMGQ